MKEAPILLVTLLAIVVGCRTPTSDTGVDQNGSRTQIATAQPGDTVRLAQGGEVRVPAAGLHIRFESVVTDSRCPHNVTCVWEGSARVRLAVTPSGEATRRIELESAVDPRAATIGAYQLLLLRDVEPLAGTRGQYAIRIEITRP